MTRVWVLRGAVLLALLFAGWAAGSALHGRRFDPWSPRNGRIRVLTTIFPLYDFARTIGGPDVEVRNLLPPGVDPHEFALSPRDAELVAGADVILANGVGLDDFILEAVHKAGVSEQKIASLAPYPLGVHIGHGPWTDDPHEWIDPSTARSYAHRIAAILAARSQSPEAREPVLSRGQTFDAELERLDRAYGAALQRYAGCSFIAFHSAFAHLADRYGLLIAGVWQKTPGREPSPQEVAALLRTASEDHVRAIFAEPQFSARALEMIAADAHLPVYTLDPLETAEDFDHTHYIPVMRRNLETLVKALAK